VILTGESLLVKKIASQNIHEKFRCIYPKEFLGAFTIDERKAVIVAWRIDNLSWQG
jgi:hypothetical protein